MIDPKGIFLLNIRTTGLSTFLGMLFLLLVSTCFAQDDLNLHGVVSDAMSSAKIEGVKITVKKDGSVHDSFTTRANGKYEFYLDIGAKYELIFEKDGFVKRSLIIDSKNVPMEIVGAGIIMPTDMSMYEITDAMKDMDLSVFDKPIGIASFDSMEQDLLWDFEHTAEVKGEIFTLIRDAEKRQKELDKAAENADKEAEELEEKFAKFIQDGDNAMTKKKYQDAVLNYKAAVELKPDDATAQTKLSDAEAKFTEAEAAKKLEDDFNAKLDEGDGYMRTEEYQKAIESYEAALELKPGESYPTEQIALATKTLEEIAANMANQEKFNELMTEGDQLASEEKFAEALVPYKSALELMPDNREVIRKIDEAELAISQAEERAKKKADYDAAIASADAAFDTEQYEEAKAAYQLASGILPDETYPGERIAECDAKIMALANAAELQAKYDEAMAAGETAMSATQYAEAIESFTLALEAKPDDSAATTKLSEAQGLLAEAQADAEKQANYQAFIDEADQLMSAEDYSASKEKYQAAKEIIPEEVYPTEQITKIDAILKEQADAEATQLAYDNAMTAGNAAMDEKNFTEAIAQYEAALKAIPEDKDATTALEGAQAAKQAADDAAALNAAYQEKIDAADAKFANEDLEGAKADYEAAIAIKNEPYPSEQIALITTMIEERANEAAEAERLAALQEAYESHMKSGNEAMTGERYADAIVSFEAALNVMSDDAAAQAKLEEAQQMQQSQMDAAAKQQLYDNTIAEADALFEQQSYEPARESYLKAIQIDASQSYPTDQIAKIEEALAAIAAEQAAADEAAKAKMVEELVQAGDVFLTNQDFQSALDKYEEAFTLAPDRADISAKIDDANNQLLAYLEGEANKQAYDNAIAEGDKLFGQENWARSKSEYEKALEVFSDQQYPQDQIALIDAKIAELEALAEEQRLKELGDEFNGLIAAGDKRFAKKKYDKALEEYEAALTLMPDNQIAQDKVNMVNDLLAQKAEAEANQQAYAALIDQADAYFKSEDYELAKLKYFDAQDIMPEERYPGEKIVEIEMLLEKQRLAEMAAELAAIEAEYLEKIREADAFMNERNYIQATARYEAALELKEEEQYPKSQLERIELLIKEEEEAAAERERLAALEAERQARLKRNRGDQSGVNTNSEEQAEQFMREAREAQEREKYERVKAEKQNAADNLEAYEAQQRAKRMSAQESVEYYNTHTDERYSAAAMAKQNQTQSSVKYKEALQANQTTQSEMSQVRKQYAMEEIRSSMSQREEDMTTMREVQNRKIDRARQEQVEMLENMEARAKMDAAETMAYNEAIQAQAAKMYAENKRAEELRAERAKDLSEVHMDRESFQASLRDRNLEDIRAKAKQNEENVAAYENSTQSKSSDKINANATAIAKQREAQDGALSDSQRMADAQRQRNADALKEFKQGEEKDFNDYYRSKLAEEYPQGVSEESSTLGNKVIITRIVVKGNRGDEYKKVVDKAGNYYFKNGRSISENTWNRETIEAFRNGSKD